MNMTRNRNVWCEAVLVVSILLLFVGIDGAHAESLWAKRTQGSLFTDHKAVSIGDLITIIIVEETEATSSAQTTTGKSAEVGLGPGLGVLDFIPLVKAEGGDQLSAGGTTTRGGSLSAKLTAKVLEILPNGNLSIEGRQTIVVNGEKQEIVVNGIVRPSDVSSDNTVLSTYVADATISYRGNGALGTKQKPGVLTRILNWVF